jgi:ribonuclease BN (tRNA processing enzyme)
MRLRILGSSGLHPTAQNPASGFLLETGETKIWLDAGTGTFAALQAVEEYTRLDAVVVSHGHADHCLDLFPLHYALLFHPDGELRLPLYCPQETWRIVSGFTAAVGGLDKLVRTFDFHPVDEGEEVAIGDVELSFHRTAHPLHTLAVRAGSHDGCLVYTSDTGPGVDLAPFARDADLLLSEATYQKARQGKPVHLTAEEAGELAERCGAGELVLTHLGPHLEPARSLEEARSTAGSRSVSLAKPGKVFQISAR